jgi:exodeoxyribonuclease VII small subunit
MLNWATPDMPASAKKIEPEQNFEGAMDRLEEIVDQMESGKMMLEELIVRYEEGMKLVKICQERLASAEQRIEIITRNHAGKPVVKDFEPLVEKERAGNSEEKGETANDEVRLF